MKRVAQGLVMVVLIVGLIAAFDVFCPNMLQSKAAQGFPAAGAQDDSASFVPGDDLNPAGEQLSAGKENKNQGLAGGTDTSLEKSQSPAYSEGYETEDPPVMITDPELLGSILLLVNKQNALREDYVPEDLVTADVRFASYVASEKKKLRKEAAQALKELVELAEQEGIEFYCVSGYRSYATQEAIFNNKVKATGMAYALKYVARPGQSEHQTGLAMDLTNAAGVNKSLTESFGRSREGQWLAEEAWRCGFIIRYPADKEDITGYYYEPWHIRYVGKEAAQIIKDSGITLEEYLAG